MRHVLTNSGNLLLLAGAAVVGALLVLIEVASEVPMLALR
jgi:hypothetical protein